MSQTLHEEHAQLAAPWKIWFDGCAAPNPGVIAIGAVVETPDGEKFELSIATGAKGCNNEAEFLALIAALDLAATQGAGRLAIFSDSRVIVDCITDRSKEPASLAELVLAVRARLGRFAAWEISWLPRHRNASADRLARAALNLPVKTKRKSRRLE